VKAFYDSLQEYYIELHNDLEKMIQTKQCSSIIMTGHSLGGTMASLYYYTTLPHKTFEIHSIITFGEPKSSCCCMNNTGVSHWRVIAGDIQSHHDPIPYFPIVPHVLHSTPSIVELHDNGNVIIDQNTGMNVPTNGSLFDLSYHHVQRYIMYTKGLVKN
jgi:hypothetical protein